MLETLKERLVWLRSVSGAPSQRDICGRAGLVTTHLSLLESGQRCDANAETIERLANVYGVSMEWLWKGKGKQPSLVTVKRAVESVPRSPRKRKRSAA